jgi:hypothetical protein
MNTGQDTQRYSKQNEGIKPEILSKAHPAHVKEADDTTVCSLKLSMKTYKKEYIVF